MYSPGVDRDSRSAWATIRRCLRAGRVRFTRHFLRRLDQRGAFWADVLAAFDAPEDVRADGFDDGGRARWIVRGPAADGTAVEVVCLIDRDGSGVLTVLVTLYWEA